MIVHTLNHGLGGTITYRNTISSFIKKTCHQTTVAEIKHYLISVHWSIASADGSARRLEHACILHVLSAVTKSVIKNSQTSFPIHR